MEQDRTRIVEAARLNGLNQAFLQIHLLMNVGQYFSLCENGQSVYVPLEECCALGKVHFPEPFCFSAEYR
jgi:hypothetical protein